MGQAWNTRFSLAVCAGVLRDTRGLQAYNSGDGSLVMTGAPTNSTGTDPLGSYTATTMSWVRLDSVTR